MGVIERGEQARLAGETCDAIGIGGERRRQNLQCDVPSQPGIARPIHLAHPAGPEGPEDLIDADAGADREGHA